MATIAYTALPSGRIADRIRHHLAALVDAWKRYRRYRSTVAELESLSPRELDDIGISPGQIRSVAHGSTVRTWN